jgi:hypothetical protein
MIAATEKKFLAPAEILSRGKAGTGGLVVWSIDAAYPEEGPCCDHPRVGRFHIMYTLEDGSWCRIPHKSAKAGMLAVLLALEEPTTEWATAYDDPPQDEDERPFGVGPPGKQKLMAYRGRIWDYSSKWETDPFEDGLESEIESFSMADVGSVCYYEKKDGVFQMVIG